MDKRILVVIALLLSLSACTGVGSESSSRQLEYHPVLDGDSNEIPFEWEERWKDLPQDPPRKPLPIDPLHTDTD